MNLSFEEWIEHAFSRQVHIQQAAWYFDPNHDWWDPKPMEAMAYLTRLFEDPERTLCWFSNDQIAQGPGESGEGNHAAMRLARYSSSQPAVFLRRRIESFPGAFRVRL